MPRTNDEDIVDAIGYIQDAEMFDHSVELEKDRRVTNPPRAKPVKTVTTAKVAVNNAVIEHDVTMTVTIARLLDIPDLINSKVRTLEKVVSREVRAPGKEV